MTAAGIWSLGGDTLHEIERFDLGPAIVLVPSEQVLLLAVDLPITGLRRRLEALPFAIEDRIAAPLNAVHIVLGAELAPQRHLAAIVSLEVMRGWMDQIAAAGLNHARLVPESLGLPLPSPGWWAVDLAGDRALIRSSDGTGFSLHAEHLAAAWVSAGRPDCLVYGAPLPAEMAGEGRTLAPVSLAARLGDPALDLRQGAFALAPKGFPALAKRIAMIAGLGLIAHGAIAAGDTFALGHIAAKHAADTRTLLAQVAPAVTVGDDLAATAANILPDSAGAPSPFLPSLVRIGGALKQLGPSITLRSIAFDAQARTLTLQVESADMAGIQRVNGALGAQGLPAESGPASMNQGKAVGSFVIRSQS
jgi:general secretion pathway protein L